MPVPTFRRSDVPTFRRSALLSCAPESSHVQSIYTRVLVVPHTFITGRRRRCCVTGLFILFILFIPIPSHFSPFSPLCIILYERGLYSGHTKSTALALALVSLSTAFTSSSSSSSSICSSSSTVQLAVVQHTLYSIQYKVYSAVSFFK